MFADLRSAIAMATLTWPKLRESHPTDYGYRLPAADVMVNVRLIEWFIWKVMSESAAPIKR